ncbi:hypothetical protein M885DRAFT_573049, partial [Pelagophyceae sp. CCMP2097]
MMAPFAPRVETSGDVASRATAPLHAQSADSPGPLVPDASAAEVVKKAAFSDAKASKTQTPILSYLDTISGAEKRMVDLAWTEFFTENGIAPFVSSSPSFGRLNKKIRPAYSLAGPAGPREHLGALLAHTHMHGTWGKLKTDELYRTLPGLKCLGVDGLMDNFSDPKLNFMDVKAGRPRFLRSIYTGSDRHTAQHIADIAIEVMKSQPGGIRACGSIQGDNAEWPALCLVEDETHVIAVRDGSHTMDLGAGDMGAQLDFVKEVVADSKYAVEAIKNHHVPHGAFKLARKVNVDLRSFSDTRFRHSGLCIESVDQNISVLKDMFTALNADDRYENFSDADKEARAYKADFLDYCAGKHCKSKKEKEARVKIYVKVKDIAMDSGRRAKARMARTVLQPWTVAIEFFSGDGVCALSVLPVMKAIVAEFEAMKYSPDILAEDVMTLQHWDIVEQILKVRIEGGSAHGEGRKVGLTLPHHTVAHLLNPFPKEPPKDKDGYSNPAARLPNDASRSLNFKGDKAKVDKANAQFQDYWSEPGQFKAMCDKFRDILKAAVAADTTAAGALAAMGPLQKEAQLQKLQNPQFIGPYVTTWIAGDAPELAYVMEATASITAGCISVERSIKVQRMIHSKVRNRLLHHKVEMLVQIYMNARLGKAPACE